MTNTIQEVTVSSEEEAGKMSVLMIVEEERMPGGASFEEAPAVHCGITCPDGSRNSGHTSPSSSSPESEVYQQQEEQCTEEELVVAVGNAAKAARRVAIPQQQKHNRLRTLTTVKETDDNTGDTDTIYGAMERHASGCVNGYTTDYENGEVCNTTNNPITATLTDSTTSANEKKNEICTWNATNAGTSTTATTKNTGAVVVDDEDDYVVGNYGEEEDRAYKTSGAATLSQSEHIIQQQQQQQEEVGINALISNIGLFLDQTWNWLHYFLVTIIFLNLVHFADRREPVVGEARSVEVEGAPVEEEEEKIQVENNNFIENDEEKVSEDESSLESEESGKIVNTEENFTESVENNSALLENSTEIIMSPNTCSIQNQQEVENAEEAIMAVVATEEKVEAVAPAPAAAAPVVEQKSEIAVENKEEMQEQQITIVLPSADQVVVVSGEDSDDSGLDGIRRDSVDSYTSEGSGNLGDTEGDIGDKSSEDGSSICNDTGAEADGVDGKQTAQKIISQVEAMFSDDHLAKDGFLLKHVRRRSDGFVSLKLVAGLRKVKQISRDFPVVLNALKDSSKLEINSEGTKVRRVEPLTPFLKAVPIKSKDKEKEGNGKDGSSNDENSHPTVSIQQNNKAPSKSGNKENNENGNRGATHHNPSRRNSNANSNGNNSRRNSNAHGNPHHRKSSNTSTTSSNNSSRHNSFSKAPGAPLPNGQQHPADLFRNVYTSNLMSAYSSGEDSQSPQVGRRRGGSLPIAALQRASINGAYVSPNSSPPNGTLIIGPNGARPKSNSYCEGASPNTMSPWLQRRKASASSRLSSGELNFSGVLRQPRGPDGTKGFATGYRAMILEERLQQQQNSAVSA